MDLLSKQELIKYVSNLDKSENVYASIKKSILNYGEQSPMTVYRGQNDENINLNYWFSSSLSYDVARNNFAGTKGIVFIIHIDNAMTLNVNEYLTIEDIEEEYLDDNEIIVQEGGKFYKNSNFDEEGFIKLSDNLIETWYHIGATNNMEMSNKLNNQQFIFEEFYNLNLDELEFVTEKNNLYLFKELPHEHIDNFYDYLLEKRREFSK